MRGGAETCWVSPVLTLWPPPAPVRDRAVAVGGELSRGIHLQPGRGCAAMGRPLGEDDQRVPRALSRNPRLRCQQVSRESLDPFSAGWRDQGWQGPPASGTQITSCCSLLGIPGVWSQGRGQTQVCAETRGSQGRVGHIRAGSGGLVRDVQSPQPCF